MQVRHRAAHLPAPELPRALPHRLRRDRPHALRHGRRQGTHARTHARRLYKRRRMDGREIPCSIQSYSLTPPHPYNTHYTHIHTHSLSLSVQVLDTDVVPIRDGDVPARGHLRGHGLRAGRAGERFGRGGGEHCITPVGVVRMSVSVVETRGGGARSLRWRGEQAAGGARQKNGRGAINNSFRSSFYICSNITIYLSICRSQRLSLNACMSVQTGKSGKRGGGWGGGGLAQVTEEKGEGRGEDGGKRRGRVRRNLFPIFWLLKLQVVLAVVCLFVCLFV
jgi:hypothetical protein